jgi:hypothetical protein
VQAEGEAYPLREPGFCHERFTELPLYLKALGYHLPLINVCVDVIDTHAQLTCREGDQALLGLPHLGDVRLPATYAEFLLLAHKHGLASQAEVWLAVPLTPGLACFALAVFPVAPRSKSNCAVFLRRAAAIADCAAANGVHVLSYAADGDPYQLRALKHLQHGGGDTIPWHGRPLSPALLTGLHAEGAVLDCSTLFVSIPDLDGSGPPLLLSVPAVWVVFNGAPVLMPCLSWEDMLHIAAKLRCRLLGRCLHGVRVGNAQACIQPAAGLLAEKSLWLAAGVRPTDLTLQDPMNIAACLRLFSPKLIACLEQQLEAPVRSAPPMELPVGTPPPLSPVSSSSPSAPVASCRPPSLKHLLFYLELSRCAVSAYVEPGVAELERLRRAFFAFYAVQALRADARKRSDFSDVSSSLLRCRSFLTHHRRTV